MVLILSVVLSLPTQIVAEEYEKDETVSVITQETFQSLFASKARSVDALEVESVNYRYDFEIREDSSVADVVMDTVFLIENIEYCVILKGEVKGQLLSSGKTFWEGPIEGVMQIDGKDYLVIASFAKIGNNSEDVQVCATIQTLENDNSFSPVVVQFGEDVITEEVFNQIYKNIEKC